MNFFEKLFDLLKFDWNTIIFGPEIIKIIFSFLIFLSIMFSRKLISNFVENKIKKLLKTKKSNLNQKLLNSLKKPLNFFIFVFAFVFATSFLEVNDRISDFLDTLDKTLITIVIFSVIYNSVEPASLFVKKIENLLSKDLLNWLINALKILIFIIGLASVLELWGIKVGPIIAGLGLFGVAVALGAQDLFKNLISGVLVLVEKRFKVGDTIHVDNIIEGVVEKIGFRSTAIRKFDKSLCTIPNFQFAENAVTNISQITYRRINWIIGLEYNSSVDQLKKVRDDIEICVKNSNEFHVSQETPVIVKIDKFSDSSIDLMVRCFVKSNRYDDMINARDFLVVKIKEIVEKNKTGFAFPSQSIYVEKN
tara:strand:- start:2815 stop:3906 length:1092 start_codon:yes stop_codon:yes gene_type:complete